MTVRPLLLIALLMPSVGCASTPANAPSTTAPADVVVERSLFDPARHMRVAEVRAGMRGYGLTVLQGVEPVRFDVEILSVLHNLTGPKQDALLARVSGCGLEQTGAIAGMSGSPIYLADDSGRFRLVGALAFGWPLSKEAVVGVQPIESMLQIRCDKARVPGPSSRPTAGSNPDGAVAKEIRRLDVTRLGAIAKLGRSRTSHVGKPSNATVRGVPRQPQSLVIPLMLGGFSSSACKQLEAALDNAVLVPFPAGTALLTNGRAMVSAVDGATTRPASDVLAVDGATTRPASGVLAGTGDSAATRPASGLVPGGSIAVPLMTGDFEATAIGTITEIIDGRVFAFGHSLNGDGAVELPLATGFVHGVVPLLSSSFKVGSMLETVGTVFGDEQSGIAGRLGRTPDLTTVNLEVTDESGELRRYRFEVVRHHQLTAALLNGAVAAALTARSELPVEHTLHFDVDLRFTGNRQVKFSNRDATSSGASGLLSLVVPVVAVAADNPFGRLSLESASLRVRVESGMKAGRVRHASLDRRKYRPGETVKVRVAYTEHGGVERTLELPFTLPGELQPGEYSLSLRDWEGHLEEEMRLRSFRFQSSDVDELLSVINEVVNVRRAALYLRLTREAPGVSVGRVSLGRLPQSRAQLLHAGGRNDVSSFLDMPTRSQPTDLVLSGSASLSMTVEAAPVGGR